MSDGRNYTDEDYRQQVLMPDEYQIEIKVRNNLFLTMMRREGYKTSAELSRACGVNQQTIGLILNLKLSGQSPVRQEWRSSIEKLATFLRCMPDDIIPKAQIKAPMKETRAYLTVDGADMAAIGASLRSLAVSPQASFEHDEMKKIISDLLTSALTPREERIVRMRFGFGCEELTLAEVGKNIGVSGQQIRQIEHKAIRKIRSAVYRKKTFSKDTALEFMHRRNE